MHDNAAAFTSFLPNPPRQAKQSPEPVAGPRAVVAIPIKDEAERIGACLDALASQVRLNPRRDDPWGVVLLFNNCTDASAAIARGRLPHLPFPVELHEVQLAPADAHAGGARGLAMDLAAAWLERVGGDDGVIVTTDADSRVAPTWIAANLAAVDAGADAVAGTIELEPGDAARLPDALRRRGRLEGTYEKLLTQLDALIDPLPQDPWPRHRTNSGASLAVRLVAYRAIGGLPRVPVGEDRALVAALQHLDLTVRHAPEVQVVTSGRLVGRAPGGAADTMRLRAQRPDVACDDGLEPLTNALQRARLRRRFRDLLTEGRREKATALARRLRVDAIVAASLGDQPGFGAAWARLEQASPVLARRALHPNELPAQIAAARGTLTALVIATAAAGAFRSAAGGSKAGRADTGSIVGPASA